MTIPEITEEQVLKEISGHQMTIIRDDGLYRHVAFKKPGTSDMRFDLITWPMYLCYTGDMGTFVFQRTDDMFTFFRTSHPCQPPEDRKLIINPGYWSQKLEAVERDEGFKQYSADKVREYFTEWMAENEASTELRKAIEDDILSCADEGPQAVHNAATDFEHDGENPFQDFWEVSMDVYTSRFLWCCYAIAWGIQQYDSVCAAKEMDRNR
jgi:hypothetical protein